MIFRKNDLRQENPGNNYTYSYGGGKLVVRICSYAEDRLFTVYYERHGQGQEKYYTQYSTVKDADKEYGAIPREAPKPPLNIFAT